MTSQQIVKSAWKLIVCTMESEKRRQQNMATVYVLNVLRVGQVTFVIKRQWNVMTLFRRENATSRK